MGQNASRPRAVEAATASPVAQTAQAATEPDMGGLDFENSTTLPKRSRRSSIGQSLRTMIRSKSSNTLSAAGSSSTLRTDNPSSRKRWRTSRRWSRTPDDFGVDDGLEHEDPPVLSVPEEEGATENVDMPLFTEQPEGLTDHLEISAPKTSSIPTDYLVHEDQEHLNEPSTSAQSEQSTSTNIGTWMGGQGSLAQALGIPEELADEDEVVISPTAFMDDTPQDSDPTPSDPIIRTTPTNPLADPSPLLAPPPPQENRAFPPPGTLVIVQGVVHTTDVSRSPIPAPSVRGRQASPSTPGYSTPMSSESESAPRSRLSSLIRQTPSMLSRPSSMFGDSPTVGDSASEPTSVEGSAQGSEGPAENVSRAPVLSPSSIDVLGTLLSVAAAATASSLMNGQTEVANADPTLNASAFAPTAGLGNLGAFAGLRPGRRPPTPPSGRERVRNVWSGLRERLRARANTGDDATTTRFRPAHEGEATAVQSRTRPDGTSMDAREIMLAEMARAFNLGLGLSEEDGANAHGDSTYIPVSHSPATGSSPAAVSGGDASIPGAEPRPIGYAARRQGLLEPPESPEGSFERFLVDLQADLRIALSGPEVFHGHSPTNATEASGSPAVNGRPAEASENNRDSSIPAPMFRATVTDEHNDEILLEQETSGDEPGDYGDNDVTSEPRVLSPLRQGATADAVPGSNTTFRTEYRPGGGINWWRSYRFPPITTPQAHGLTPTGAQPPVAGSSSDPSSTTFGAAASASESDSNTVVPVIVVGLQSVNMDERGGPGAFGEHAHDHEDIFGNANAEGDLQADGTDVNIGGTWPADGEDGTPGATHAHPGAPPIRSWHTRAANALRNLRPGRRTTRATQNEGAGSRTFLIYVIGGYYPPDHSMITGADNLDSFEALWELADLLGQVKPQTVTKEEIDKSGLEIISPETLNQYEQERKVSSNCLDRCLICLDDYNPQDQLRLLSCKHAFHKTCVDEWLTVGKNNCPACRTPGIPEAPTI